MKRREVMKLLRVSDTCIMNYLAKGYIKATRLPSGQYDYDEESVYAFLNKDVQRGIYLYARVSSTAQKKELETQIEVLKQYCFMNGLRISGIYSDVASALSFEKRKQFFELLEMIMAGKVKTVVITYKDRLSRIAFEFFSILFKRFGCNITVVSEVGSSKLDAQEIFEEIVALLHCFSMKMYSSRRLSKIKEVLADESLD